VVFKTTAIDHSAIPPRWKSRQTSRDPNSPQRLDDGRRRCRLFRPIRAKSVQARSFSRGAVSLQVSSPSIATPAEPIAIVSLGLTSLKFA